MTTPMSPKSTSICTLDEHNRVQFIVAADATAFVDGQRAQKGHLENGQQLRIGRSIWHVEGSAGTPDISSFFGSIGDRISEVAGVEKIEGFKIGDMFSQIWRKRSDEEMEDYFAVGTLTDTPKSADADTGWPRNRGLFFKTFILSALVYVGLLFAYKQFDNQNLVPGLLVIGSFVMPFTLLILFFEVIKVLRNTLPLYSGLKTPVPRRCPLAGRFTVSLSMDQSRRISGMGRRVRRRIRRGNGQGRRPASRAE